MAETGIQSPLGINVVSSNILNEGLTINPVNQEYLGTSKYNSDYTPGSIVNNTCLKWITYALNAAFNNGVSTQTLTPLPATSVTIGLEYVIYRLGNTDWNSIGLIGTAQEGMMFVASSAGNGTGEVFLNGEQTGVSVFNYDNILALGQSRIPALSNSLPPTYLINDPSGVWEGQATTGYPIPGDGTRDLSLEYHPYEGQGQEATWFPYNSSNPNISVTQWGFLRCLALQAWNVFNWNGSSPANQHPEYKNYVTQINTFNAFLEQSNEAIITLRNSISFLDGVYSNMNDLISADITGVSLSTQAFGQDCINLGNAINLNKISSFGLPSSLLITLEQANAMTRPVILALLIAGLSQSEIDQISAGEVTPSLDQEQRIYSAFLAIQGSDATEIFNILNCKTKGLAQLTDLLNVKKMFPISYTSLTVPIYNTSPSPNNSKTYYLLFVDREVNPQLLTPRVKQAVGPIIIPAPPPIIEPTPEPEPLPLPEIIPNVEPIIVPPPPEPIIPLPNPLPPPPPIPDPPSGKIGGGGCVALESFVPMVEIEQKHNGREITKAWMLESGMKISLGTEELQIVDGSVVKTLNDYQPCVRISTSDGITLVCSTTAPILTKDKGFIPATEVYGKRVAVMRNGVTWYDEVVGLEDVGMKFVRVIDAGNNSFWAGERPGAFILHHNVPINDKLNFDKK